MTVLLKRKKESGLSVKSFCSNKGIGTSTLLLAEESALLTLAHFVRSLKDYRLLPTLYDSFFTLFISFPILYLGTCNTLRPLNEPDSGRDRKR